MNRLSYLALGDSYTVGEAVLLADSFPYQVVQILRKGGHSITAPEILAKTGWTTDNLAAAMKDYHFLPHYDYVSLLIGVNNQYQSLGIEEYKAAFEGLLQKAIELAGSRPKHVLVLSIPDYSVTPFAAGTDKAKTAHELEQFNGVIMAVATQYKVGYINITPESKEAGGDASLLAPDGLHPSASVYRKWARQIAAYIAK